MTLQSQSEGSGAKVTPEPEREELRVALALNGGVSLAVWMGGCAVELDRARRADSEPEQSIYGALCACFGRRVEIDILTGTSAGGINGALLGAAIAKDGRLDAGLVRSSWIELGDLGEIMQDPNTDAPTALMDGKKFHVELLKIFEDVLATGGGSADPPPSLDVTMTDVLGVERRFRDTWGSELIAREHRPRFKFRRPEHFSAEALAAAARTSASFPFAFDPWRVEGNPKVLAGLPNPTYGMDGGLLNNAPIREALELIPTRFAAATVRRYVCYVNADPTLSNDATIGPEPSLMEVGGYVVNLPRKAPLVDHLYAIREAVERPKRLVKIQGELITLDLDQLQAVAGALFGAYCRRRSLESLEELLTEPGDANAMLDLLQEVGGSLPWIPRKWEELGAETEDPEKAEADDCCKDAADDGTDKPRLIWEWGTRPAQRALHLLLDVLRPAIACADADLRPKLLKARLEIQQRIGELEGAHHGVTGAAGISNPSRFDPELAAEIVNDAAAKATRQARETRETVLAGAATLRNLLTEGEVGDLKCFEGIAEALFGPEPNSGASSDRFFLRRVLSIEVVRRALSAEADIESAEPLNFVQLTPDAPSPIFTPDPLRRHGPATARQKLTGVGLGHFAGFYRRSWRANDFMWGRLDAAARIVDLILDAPPTDFGTGAEAETDEQRASERAGSLAAALVDVAATEGAWLLEELFPPEPENDKPKPLPDRIAELVKEELRAAKAGDRNQLPRTRALFQRMAQLEVLREELGHLRKESRKDRELGAAARPLELGGKKAEHDVAAQIKDIRKIYEKGGSLPKQLEDDAEAVSNLSLQTITHAGFVGLAAIRTTGLPLSKAPGLIRPPLLAVAGTVATFWTTRVVAAIAFWAAALFITSQIATADPHASPALATILSPATLTGIAALLGVAGFVLVPVLRVAQDASRGRNIAYGAGLLVTGGALAAGLALAFGDFQVEDVILAPAAKEPPALLLWFTLALLGLASASHLPGGRLVGKVFAWARRRLMLPLLGLALIAIGIASGLHLADVFDDSTWQAVTMMAALVGAPVAAAFAVRILSLDSLRRKFLRVWPFKKKKPTADAGPTKPRPTA